MDTPWGRSQTSDRIDMGVTRVSTARHGGLMISAGYAEKYLSREARDKGLRHGLYYAYEEDCLWAVAMWELKHLWGAYLKLLVATDMEKFYNEMFCCLSLWNPEYLIAKGVEPDAELYTRFKAMKLEQQMRADKHPDLIVAAWGDWDTKRPGVIRVHTADGLCHFVTDESYRAHDTPNLLSNSVIVFP